MRESRTLSSCNAIDSPIVMLIDPWRSLSDACASDINVLYRPARFHPPGDTGINVGLNDITGFVVIIPTRIARPDNIKGRRLGTMFGNICFHRPNVIWCDLAPAAVGVDFRGK